MAELQHYDCWLSITCSRCRIGTVVRFYHRDLKNWVRGELIQNAFPYLSVDDRELMISQTCPQCYAEITYNYEDDIEKERGFSNETYL